MISKNDQLDPEIDRSLQILASWISEYAPFVDDDNVEECEDEEPDFVKGDRHADAPDFLTYFLEKSRDMLPMPRDFQARVDETKAASWEGAERIASIDNDR